MPNEGIAGYIAAVPVALAVALAVPIGARADTGPLQEGERLSSISREQAEALVSDDPEMTPRERQGFVNGLLVPVPKARISQDELRRAAASIPPDVLSELTRAGGRGQATVHLVLDEAGEVFETRYVPPKPSETGITDDELRVALEAYGAWAADVARQWRFERPEAAPYSFILDLSHQVGESGTTYGWRLRASGRLVEQPATLASGGGTAARPEGHVVVPSGSSAVVDPSVPWRVGDGRPAPERIRYVEPVYPQEAAADGIQGTVVVEATIGADGKVEDARILKSVPALDEAALEAVRQWEYTPTLENGVPVPVVMTMTVNFTLE